METHLHTINNLFAQLGLPSDAEDILEFIESHRSLDANIALSDAPFWTASQSRFLRDEIIKDSDWAVVIDKLSTSLRK